MIRVRAALGLVVLWGCACGSTGWSAEEPALPRFEQTITLQIDRPDALPNTLVTLAGQAGNDLQRLRTLYTAAEMHWKNQRWADAAGLYAQVAEEAKSVDPYLVHCAQLRMAQIRLRTHQTDQALALAQTLVDVPTPLVAREASLLIVRAHLTLSRREAARTALETHLARYPDDQHLALIDVLSGLIAYDQGDFAAALKHFEQHPDDFTALYALLAIHCMQQQFPPAIAAYQQLVNQRAPAFWLTRSRLLLSEALYQGKDDPLAATYLTQALSGDLPPDLKAWALQRLASIRFRQKDYPASEIALKELLAQFPKHPSAPDWQYFYDTLPAHAKAWEEVLAEAQRTARQHLWGLIPFSRAHRTPAARQEAAFRVLWAHLSLQHHTRVVRLATRFLHRYPASPLSAYAALARGISQESLGQHEAARMSFHTVLDHAPSGAASTAIYLMALMHQTEDRAAHLVTALNRLFSEFTPALTEHSPAVHKETAFWIAEAHARLGDYAHAEQAYRRFLAVNPAGPLAPYALQGLSLSLANQNRVPEAAGVQQQAIALAEEHKNPEVGLNGRFQLAKMAFNQRDYDQAATMFDQVAARAEAPPMKVEALYYGGLSLAGLKYYSEAITKWQQLVRDYPLAPLRLAAYQQMGKTAFGLARYDQAAEAYQAIITADPLSPEAQEALFQLVQCAYNKGDTTGALTQWRQFRDRYPADPRVRTTGEMILATTEGQGLPENDVRLLLAEAPHSSAASSVMWRRGAEAFNARDYKMAEEWFRELLVKYPVGAHAPEAYFYLGESLFHEGSFNEAVQAYGHFATQYATHPLAAQAAFQRATSLFQQQDYFAAAEAFRQFHTTFPSHALGRDALLNEALAYKKSFHPDEAIQAYRSFLSRWPEDPKAVATVLALANLYELKGQFAAAAETYGRVPPAAPEYLEARYHVGECYRSLKDVNHAAAAYEALLRLEPKDHEFRIAGLLRLAQLYEQVEAPTTRILAVYEEIAQSSRNQEIVLLVQQRIKAYKEPAPAAPVPSIGSSTSSGQVPPPQNSGQLPSTAVSTDTGSVKP